MGCGQWRVVHCHDLVRASTGCAGGWSAGPFGGRMASVRAGFACLYGRVTERG